MKTSFVFFVRGILLMLLIAGQTSFAQSNFWQTVDGPYGNCITSIVANTTGSLFVSTRDSGVFRSTNSGSNWSKINSGITNITINGLAITSGGTIFAASGGTGAFKSTSQGDGWTVAGNIFGNIILTGIVINSNDNLHVSTFRGFYRSTNGGNTFSVQRNGLTDSVLLCVALNSSGHVFVGTDNSGIYRSTNNGTNWAKLGAGLPAIPILSIAVNSSGHIFAGTEGDGVYRSTDNGTSWTKLAIDPSSKYINNLKINGSGHIFAATNRGILRSINNGDSWSQLHSDLLPQSFFSLGLFPNNRIIAGTWDSKIFISSDDGSTWTNVYLAPKTLTGNTLLFNASDHLFAGTVGAGMYSTTNNGSLWKHANMTLSLYSPYDIKSFALTTNNQLFAGSEGYGIFRSSDAGENIVAINNGLSYRYNYTFAINGSGTIFSGTGGGGVFRSMSNGDVWQAVNTGLTTLNVFNLIFNSVGHLLAGTLGGGVFRSIDNGDNWTQANTGLPNRFVNALLKHPNGNLYCATSGDGIYLSTNNGDSWTRISANVTLNNVKSLIANSLGYLFAGTTGDGVYRSKDGGYIWTQINGGLANKNVNALAINSAGFIYAATDFGLFRSLVSTTTTAPSIAATPTQLNFSSVQVNNTTTKSIELSNQGDADLIIQSVNIVPGTDFTTSFTTPRTLKSAEKVTMSIQFKPIATGARSATLSINSNDSQNSTLTIAINGSGTAIPKPSIVVKTTSLDFGTVTIPSTSNGYVTIENTGNANLTVSSASLSGTDASGFLMASSLPITIAPNGRDSIKVIFQPTTSGAKIAALTISHDDVDQGSISVSLSGTAVTAAALNVSSLIVNFGTLKITDGVQQKSVVLQNTGDLPLTITKKGITGPNALEFIVLKNIGNTLVGQTTDSIVFSFSPSLSTPGDKTATFTIETDAASSLRTEIALIAKVNSPTAVDPLHTAGFVLHQNYPNPVSSRASGQTTTDIRFEIGARSFVQITIASALGQNIAAPVADTFDAGEYSVRFDISLIPAGIYFYRLTSNGFSQLRKMIVIK